MASGLPSLLASALLAGGRCYKTTAQNTVNAENEDYAVLHTHMYTRGAGSKDMSAIASAPQRQTDPTILKALAHTKSELELLRQKSQTSGVLSAALGTVGDEALSLSGRIDAFFRALETPSLAQNQGVYLATLVQRASELAEGFSSFSHQVQDLRASADYDISEGVKNAQSLLEDYHTQNQTIGKSTQDSMQVLSAQDRKDAILLELSTYLEVTQTIDREHSKGQNELHYLWGPDGVPLVTHQKTHDLSFTPHVGMLPADSLEGGALSPLELKIDARTIDLTNKLHSGKFAGLFEMRDHFLPDIQAILDAGATALADTFNAIHNQGAAYNTPKTYQSSRVLDPSLVLGTLDPGILRVATVNEEGGVTQFQDISLSATTTLQDLLDTLTSMDHINAYMRDGHAYVVSDADGIAFRGLNEDGENALTRMGLNDLFWSSEERDFSDSTVPTGFSFDMHINPAIAKTPKLFAHALLTDDPNLEIQLNTPLPTGLQKADGRTLQNLFSEKLNIWTFKEAGDWAEARMKPIEWGKAFLTDITFKAETANRAFKSKESSVTVLSESLNNIRSVDTTQNQLEQVQWSSYMQNIMTVMGTVQNLHRFFLQIISSS